MGPLKSACELARSTVPAALPHHRDEPREAGAEERERRWLWHRCRWRDDLPVAHRKDVPPKLGAVLVVADQRVDSAIEEGTADARSRQLGRVVGGTGETVGVARVRATASQSARTSARIASLPLNLVVVELEIEISHTRVAAINQDQLEDVR